jgi:signal transduction histidine kinase
MRVSLSRLVVRYGTGVLSVTAAFFFTLLLWPLVRPTSTPLFLAAIVVTAWRFGRGPALMATLLSGLVIDYVFIEPRYQLSGGWDDLTRLAVFTIEGGILSWVIVSRKEIGDQVTQSREELRALSRHLQILIERERTRIAREIHDELGQELTGLKFDVSWLRDKALQSSSSSEPELEKLNATLQKIDAAIHSVRKIATELRPPVLDTLGLTAAIEWQAADFENRTGINCKLSQMEEDIPVDRDCVTAVFRIFQESLTNIARHAKATEVRISLERRNGRLVLRLQDNGKGIQPEDVHGARSLGILGMQERVRLLNGELSIAGNDGHGTVVSVEIPLKSENSDRG